MINMSNSPTKGSSSRRLNRAVLLGVLAGSELEGFLDRLTDEEVECLIDLRSERKPGARKLSALLQVAAKSREMYYAHLPALAKASELKRGQPPRELAWAARTALRHRTCFVTSGDPRGAAAVRAAADLVGLRILELGTSPWR